MRKIFKGSMPVLAFTGLLWTVVAALVAFPLQDYDTFWHLAYGRAMVESGTFINHEIFSYTAPGAPLGSHSQLAQVVLYLIYRAGGADGLLVFKILVALVVYGLVVRTARLFAAPAAVAASIGLLAMVAGMSRFVERPELFSILGLAWLVYLLCRYSRSGGEAGKGIFALPVIFVLWDYLHGAVYGLVFLGAFVAAETLKHLAAPRVGWLRSRAIPLQARAMRRLWLWTGITLGAMLLHPNGLLHYEGFWRISSLAGDFAMYGEWASPAFDAQFFGYWLWLALVLILLVMSIGRIDLTLLITLLPFACLSLQYNRATLSFCLVAVPLVAESLSSLCKNGKRFTRLKAMAPPLILLLATGTAIVYKAWFTIDSFKLGTGVNENVFPAGSTRFVKAAGLTGNLYNMDGFGGYLAYHLSPERKIFHYNQPGVFTALPDYVHNPETRSRWNINYAIIGKAEELQMLEREGFVPVYWEPTAMVLVQATEANGEIIERYGIRYFQPLLSDERFRDLARSPLVFPRLAQEMADYLALRHDRRLADLLGNLLAPSGGGLPVERHLDLVQSALPFNRDSPWLLAAQGGARYRSGMLAEARESFQAALRLEEGFEEARLQLGYIAYDLKDYQQAAGEFQRVLQKNPDNANAHYGMALTSVRLAQTSKAREHFGRYLELVPNGPFAEKARQFLASFPSPGWGG